MGIKKAPIVPPPDQVSKVINAGSPPAEGKKDDKEDKKNDSKEDIKETKFTMVIDGDLASKIDEVRDRTKSSRRSWFLLAAIEKLKRDGDL